MLSGDSHERYYFGDANKAVYDNGGYINSDRYLDDLGKASTEEKDALKAEHDEYSAVCAANEITNNFVDMMVQHVMELPERDV